MHWLFIFILFSLHCRLLEIHAEVCFHCLFPWFHHFSNFKILSSIASQINSWTVVKIHAPGRKPYCMCVPIKFHQKNLHLTHIKKGKDSKILQRFLKQKVLSLCYVRDIICLYPSWKPSKKLFEIQGLQDHGKYHSSLPLRPLLVLKCHSNNQDFLELQPCWQAFQIFSTKLNFCHFLRWWQTNRRGHHPHILRLKLPTDNDKTQWRLTGDWGAIE